MKIPKNWLLFSLLALVGSLLVGYGYDAVEKLEQRVDELEDELEQVKRDQSYSRDRSRSVFGLFGRKEEATEEAIATEEPMPSKGSAERNSGWTSDGTDNVDDSGNIAE